MRANQLYKKLSPFLLLLIVLSFITTIIPIELPFGVTLTPASVFVLLILRLYGFKVALLTNFLVQGIAIGFFDATPWNLYTFLEIFFFAIVFRYKPKANFVLIGFIFWVIISGPISAWISYSAFGLTDGTVLLFQVTISALNGVFNIFIIDLLLTYLPIQQWLGGKRRRQSFQIKKLLFHFTFTVMLIPFLLYVTISSVNTIQLNENNLNRAGKGIVKQVSSEMKSWKQEDIFSLQLNGLIQTGYLEDMIKEIAKQNDIGITVTDIEGKIVASSRDSLLRKESYQWSDNYSIKSRTSSSFIVVPVDSVLDVKNWRNASYVNESDFGVESLNIHVEIPLKPFQDDLISGFLSQLTFLLVLLLLAFLFSGLFYRVLASSLNQLALSTTGLPMKLKQDENIDWPTSNIVEIRSLIANFQHMSVNLKTMFKESNTINEKLRKQAEMLQLSEKKLHDLAYYDVLTALPNRQHFQNSLTTIIDSAKENKKQVALLFLDLNQFKQINDTLGHMAGDELLQIIARKLKSLKTDNIHPNRLSGDEFVIIMDDSKNKQEIINTANRVKEIFQQPFEIMGQTLHISSSIGVSIFPDDASEQETLIQNADIAMYRSKEQDGTTIEFYTEAMRVEYLGNVMITNELRSAVDANEFELFYQPKVDDTHRISSIEALIRWNNPKVGSVSPATFIPLAEEEGLIRMVDEWVLNEACKQNKKWQDEGFPKIKISVNISAKHFYQSYLVEMVEAALKHSQLDPSYLQLEITESVFIENMEYVNQTIQKIKALGVSISIDDFGKGYSSLNHIIRLPITEIKLDKEFIRDIDTDDKKSLIVKYMIELANQLSFNVVAEGVETREELGWLKEIGCDEMQGFLFSKPLAREEFERILNSVDAL